MANQGLVKMTKKYTDTVAEANVPASDIDAWKAQGWKEVKPAPAKADK